jgi:amidase/aspartyl-tRNA(Asn)/glutamyl-tRNA(Gln) amidotransferase subunit A
VADALDTRDDVTLPQVGRAHAAANLIAAVESAALHFGALRSRAADFEPSMRDLLLAGALLPAAWSQQAQRLRRWFALRAAELFREVDVLIAPATPDPARPADAGRPGLALLTQPFSFIGLPVCVVPVWGCHATLPMGVQIVAAPWREDLVLRIAHHLQLAGVAHAPVLMPGETHAGAMRLEPVDSRF